MEMKETKLKIYKGQMIDFEKLQKNEPELFDDLLKDYPLKDGIYMFCVEKKGK
jgi:hypothetical protein